MTCSIALISLWQEFHLPDKNKIDLIARKCEIFMSQAMGRASEVEGLRVPRSALFYMASLLGQQLYRFRLISSFSVPGHGRISQIRPYSLAMKGEFLAMNCSYLNILFLKIKYILFI